MSSLLPRFPTFPLPHFAVSLPLHFLAFSRHSVSGDDWKAAQIPLVACPALLSNHPHWQSAWNRLPHCTTSPLPHFPASTLSYFCTSLLPCLPSLLLPCFPTSPLPCFPASPLPCFPTSQFPCFPSSLQCTFLLPFFPRSLFPAALHPCFPTFQLPTLSCFPCSLLSFFPFFPLPCFPFVIASILLYLRHGDWMVAYYGWPVHWSLEGDGHWLWISFISAVSFRPANRQ